MSNVLAMLHSAATPAVGPSPHQRIHSSHGRQVSASLEARWHASCLRCPPRLPPSRLHQAAPRGGFRVQDHQSSTWQLAGQRKHAQEGSSHPRASVQRRGVRAEAGRVRFSATLTTDIPFRERYGVSFEEYLSNRDRMFDAFFPDKQRYERLNPEEWRIYMLPLSFFFLTVRPVVDMRLTLSSPVSPTATPLLSLKATKCELRGVAVSPADFLLGVDGVLYGEKAGRGPRLRGRMGLSVDLAVPDSLTLVPPGTIEIVGSALLNQVLENMKDRVNTRVLQDYAGYAWEQAQSLKQRAKK